MPILIDLSASKSDTKDVRKQFFIAVIQNGGNSVANSNTLVAGNF